KMPLSKSSHYPLSTQREAQKEPWSVHTYENKNSAGSEPRHAPGFESQMSAPSRPHAQALMHFPNRQNAYWVPDQEEAVVPEHWVPRCPDPDLFQMKAYPLR